MLVLIVTTLLLTELDLTQKRKKRTNISFTFLVMTDRAQSLPKQQYSLPAKVKKMSGYKPTNCGEPEDVISNISTREAYRRATAHIKEDPYKNCSTIEADNAVKLWKATELPVMLTKAERGMTFLYAGKLKHCS